MDTAGWLRRLREKCPGWLFWKITASEVNHWCAVPAPDGATVEYLSEHPDLWKVGMVSASTPAELRTLVRERYGWHDYCETCGVLARECGHRQPETRVRP